MQEFLGKCRNSAAAPQERGIFLPSPDVLQVCEVQNSRVRVWSSLDVVVGVVVVVVGHAGIHLGAGGG